MRTAAVLLGVLLIASVHAADPNEAARARALAEELRCLVCQNQTIADSHAPLAIDLRHQIDAQIADGKTDREIVTYMTDRYGDFIVYRPPLNATTFLLWCGPFLLLAFGALMAWRFVAGRRRAAVPAPLSEAERQRARRLLD